VPDGAPDVAAWQNRCELLRDGSHVRNYSPSEWRGFLREARFAIEDLALLDESTPMLLGDWLEKGGCTGEPAAQVRRMFAEATEDIQRTFAIQKLENGDTEFRWVRVVLSACRS
jgi:hypothetical protein